MIACRLKVMGHLVGCCALWLLLTPSMEHIMDPLKVGKFIGFLEAKGLASSTMKKVRHALPWCIPCLPLVQPTCLGAWCMLPLV